MKEYIKYLIFAFCVIKNSDQTAQILDSAVKRDVDDHTDIHAHTHTRRTHAHTHTHTLAN